MTACLSRKKKALILLLMLCCIFVAYLQIFTIRSKANVATSNWSWLTVGAPLEFEFSLLNNTYSGIINRPNVYAYETDGTTVSWYEGVSGTDLFYFSYSVTNNGAADIFLNFNNYATVDTLSIDRSIFVKDFSDLQQNFMTTLGVYEPVDSSSVAIDSLEVFYRYTVATVQYVSGRPVLNSAQISGFYTYNKTADYFYVQLFNSSFLNSSFFSQNAVFFDSSGDRYVWILDASATLVDTYSKRFYFEPFVSKTVTLSDYDTLLRSRDISVYDAETVAEIYSFDDISWTDWLVNSVGSFMNFEFIPGFSISGIFALLVGMSLFMVFLKVFAGG